jgi:hypothetical protein
VNALLLSLLLSAEPYLDLRESARAVLQAECGLCHIRGLKTAKAGALAIFDLTRGDFADGLTEVQMASVRSRLGSDLRESAEPRNVSAADQKRVADFLAAELERRKKP